MRLANHWAEKGFQVRLLLIRGDGVYSRRLDRRIEVRTAQCDRVRDAVPWLRRMLALDITTPTLAFGGDLGGILAIMKLAGLVPGPVIFREWSLPMLNAPRSRLPIYRWLITHLDGAIAQTKFARDMLQEVGVKGIPIAVIPNPMEAFPEPVQNPDSLALLAVGRLAKEKGFERLISAFAALKRLHPDATLTLAGDGPLRGELEALARRENCSESVRFLGFVSDINQVYASAGVFVLSSHHEGMPNALLEAIAAGCRAIASGGGGVRELLGRLNLEDCYISGEDFRTSFLERFKNVSAAPLGRWRAARRELADLCDIDRVAGEYHRFCWSVTASRRII